jgi:hypothetical protein
MKAEQRKRVGCNYLLTKSAPCITWFLIKLNDHQYLIHSSTILQPSFGPWPLLQFRNILHIRKGSFDDWSAHLKASTLTRDNTNTDIHASSGIRTRDPRVRASEDNTRPLWSATTHQLGSEGAGTVRHNLLWTGNNWVNGLEILYFLQPTSRDVSNTFTVMLF